jgi:predicted HicB family RNase H-like nuclease
MKYKGYTAKVEFDEEAEIFFGTVVNTRDTITFQSENAHELKDEFQASIDDYLEYCKELGRSPEKPFSGRLMLRVSPDLHQRLYTGAVEHRQSLNEYINNTLQSVV